MSQQSEVNPKEEAERKQREVELYCCPFCGALVLGDVKHKRDCFFIVSDRLRKSSGHDVALVQKVANAWKTRSVPVGHKLISQDIGNEAKEGLDNGYPNDIEIESKVHAPPYKVVPLDVKETLFPIIFKYLRSVW